MEKVSRHQTHRNESLVLEAAAFSASRPPVNNVEGGGNGGRPVMLGGPWQFEAGDRPMFNQLKKFNILP